MSEKFTNDIAEKLWKNEHSSLPIIESKLSNEPINLDIKLIELCSQIPKPEIINEEKDPDINILWLKNKNEKILNELDIEIFYSKDEFDAFITKLQTNNIFLIIDQSMLKHILPFLDDLTQIIFIYISIDTEIDDLIPTIDTKKTFRKVSSNKEEIFHSIREDIRIYAKDSIFTTIFDLIVEEESTNQTNNASFIWYNLLINSLFDLGAYHETAKNDLVNYCREQYLNNISQQNKITEFEKEYLSTDAIRWYTRDSFIYRLLNKALRTRDIDSIFKFRFFIIDLQNQLESFYNEKIMESNIFVYRGQEISNIEFKKLEKSIGKFISVYTYFSASIDKKVALDYAQHSSAILFEIDMKNVISMKNKRIRPVYVGDKSYIPDELEVIFPIGSTFEVDFIDKENIPYRVRLTLAEDKNYERIFNIFQKNYVIKPPSTVLFADLFISMGEYDKAERYLQILLEELQKSDDKVYVYHSMGKIYYEKDDYNCALDWFNKALDFIKEKNIFCATIYLYIAKSYRAQNEYNAALEYCHKVLDDQNEMDWSDLADLYDEFGTIYSFMNNFNKALEYLTQSLSIRQSNKANYRDYISTYISLVILYFKKSDYHEVQKYLKEILHILLNTMPKTHPDVISTYTLIGTTYQPCGDNQSAAIYCQKALDLVENLSKKEIISPATYLVLYTTLAILSECINDQLFYVHIAFDIYIKFKNIIPETNPVVSNLYNQMGITYYHLYDFNFALYYFHHALDLNVNNENRCSILLNIATTYINKSDSKSALDYLNKSYQISLELNHRDTGEIYSQYSRAYELENNLEKAIFYSEEGLRFNEINNNIDALANNYLDLAKLCPDKKSTYMEKFKEIVQKNDLSSSITHVFHLILGYYFKEQNDFVNALEYYQLYLKSELTIIPPCYCNLIIIYADIGFIYQKMKDNDNALDYLIKSCEMYLKLSNLKRLPYKDQKIMLSSEKYLIKNVQECSAITSRILIVYYYIGKIYIERNKNELVLKYIQQAHEIFQNYQGRNDLSNSQQLYYLLGSIYKSIGKIDQALYYYEKSVQSLTMDYCLHGFISYLIGSVYQEQGNYLMSLSKYKISLTFLYNYQCINQTHLCLVNASVASLYSEMKNYQYALNYSEQALKHCLLMNPIVYDSVMTCYKASIDYLTELRPWDHKKELNSILRLKELTQYSLKDHSLQDLYYSIGSCYFKNGEYEQALVYCYKSLKYSDMNMFTIDVTYAVCMAVGELDKAYNLIKETIDRKLNMKTIDWNNLSLLYIYMGIIHYERGEYKLAVEFYQNAFNYLDTYQNNKRHSSYSRIYNQIALIYFQDGKLNDAKIYAEKCRDIIYSLDDKNIAPININITLGLIECQSENYYLALDYFGQAWELIYNRHLDYHPERKILYNHIGYVYFKLGHISLAMKNYLKTLSLYHKFMNHHDLAQVYKNIGLIYEYEYENYSLALIFYQRALELVPTKQHPHYMLYKNMIRTLKKKTSRKYICPLM
ncbi:unnamed protein product [Adineta steineri]|uniref:Uncharacterized protein n=1 Tax=Adineta steineri TaxID=433720 RepID=A0A814LZ40_9BILA|nr:unnamed protein product [Adineta steineri]CAF1070802.1 unnamed protein product [Adineta steineri]